MSDHEYSSEEENCDAQQNDDMNSHRRNQLAELIGRMLAKAWWKERHEMTGQDEFASPLGD